MKNKVLLFAKAIIFIVLATELKISLAQTQSQQLPIPSENASVINFTDPAAPAITNLPAHDFYVDGDPNNPGDPHNENHLVHSDPVFIERYLGQHPMYGQTIIHDAEGNLLFFIVDNNIYNRYGVAMIDYNSILAQTPAFSRI